MPQASHNPKHHGVQAGLCNTHGRILVCLVFDSVMFKRGRLQPYIRTLLEAVPLSLMEFADRLLLKATSLMLLVARRVCRSRSDLSCHHIFNRLSNR